MAFYIVQHGQSLAKDLDPEKGLSNQGIETVEKIARVAQQYGVKVDRIQ
ncbi:MAG: phosphohistidine phosphatase SixA, partial [Chloroflexi bacterium]